MDQFWLWLGAATLALVLLIGWLLHVGQQARKAEWGNWLLNSFDGLCRQFCKHFHRLEYDPIDIPRNGGALVASNHLSGLDPLLLTCASTKPMRFMIATEQFQRPWLNWLYRSMGCIPVDRTGAPEKAFYAARAALKQGELIAVFPQGRITRPEESVPLKRGVVVLADLADAPIIPVRLSGITGVGRVLTAIVMRSRVRLETGPYIRVGGPRDDAALERLYTYITGEPGGRSS